MGSKPHWARELFRRPNGIVRTDIESDHSVESVLEPQLQIVHGARPEHKGYTSIMGIDTQYCDHSHRNTEISLVDRKGLDLLPFD